MAESMQRIAYSKIEQGQHRAGWSLLREADRFDCCGREYLKLACEGEARVFHIRITCKSRICPECGRRLYGRIVARMRDVIGKILSARKKGYFLTLVTLTFNKARFGDELPQRRDIARAYRESGEFLRRYFGKYRMRQSRSGKWVQDRKRWRGGGFIAVMEVGQDNNNLHVHAVCFGHYEAYAAMSKSWAQITGDSVHVDFQPVSSPTLAANYVLKYITKPPSTDSYNRLAQYAAMIKGTRRLRTGGVFYNCLAVPKREARRFCCPFCLDRLKFRGYVTEDDSSKVVPLLPLLDVLAARDGKPLPSWSVLYFQAAD